MPLSRAKQEVLPWALPEWRLLKELKENVLKERFADVKTSSLTARPPKGYATTSQAALDQIVRGLNREMRQIFTMTDWSLLRAVLDPEEPTADDQKRRSSFREALVQVCEFLDGLVNPRLRRRPSPQPGSVRNTSSRHQNLESLYISLRGSARKVECLSKSNQLISLFSTRGSEKSKLERGLRRLEAFNDLVGDFVDIDPLPLPLSGPMGSTLEFETLQSLTRHATASLKAIFKSFCLRHEVLVELPAIADLTKTTNTLSLLISPCRMENASLQEAEISAGTNVEGQENSDSPAQKNTSLDDHITNTTPKPLPQSDAALTGSLVSDESSGDHSRTLELCRELTKAWVENYRFQMSLLADRISVSSKEISPKLKLSPAQKKSIQHLFPAEGTEVEDVRISNSRKALAVGLALCTLAYLNSGWTFEMHAEEIYSLDSEACKQHFFARFHGEKEVTTGPLAFGRIRARLISLAKLLLAIEMGDYGKRTESTDDHDTDWDSLKRELTLKADQGRRWAANESKDRIPYFNAIMACLWFETYMDADIQKSDEGYLDPRIPTYVREKIVETLLQSITTTKRQEDPRANMSAPGWRGSRAFTASSTQIEALHPLTRRRVESDRDAGDRIEKKTRFAFLGDSAAAGSLPPSEPPDYDPSEKKAGELFFKKMKLFHDYIKDYVGSTTVRIAVLDTGVNSSHSGIATAKNKGKIKMHKRSNKKSSGQESDSWCKNWIGRDEHNVEDKDGHGTHVADLIHRTAPEAEIYIARISEGREFSLNSAKYVAEAIAWAVKKNVHIISMSLGLSRPIRGRDNAQDWKAARDLINGAIKVATSQMFFVASGNDGKNDGILFPANSNRNHVFAIFASDGKGTASTANPTCGRRQAFMTLGKSVPLQPLPGHGEDSIYCSGTSYATPIAAGIAALCRTIDFRKFRKRISKEALDELEQWGPTVVTMLFELMGPTEQYQYVCPWNMLTMSSLDEKEEEDLILIQRKFAP